MHFTWRIGIWTIDVLIIIHSYLVLELMGFTKLLGLLLKSELSLWCYLPVWHQQNTRFYWKIKNFKYIIFSTKKKNYLFSKVLINIFFYDFLEKNCGRIRSTSGWLDLQQWIRWQSRSPRTRHLSSVDYPENFDDYLV